MWDTDYWYTPYWSTDYWGEDSGGVTLGIGRMEVRVRRLGPTNVKVYVERQ